MSLENEIRQMDRLNVWRRNHFNQYRVIIVSNVKSKEIFQRIYNNSEEIPEGNKDKADSVFESLFDLKIKYDDKILYVKTDNYRKTIFCIMSKEYYDKWSKTDNSEGIPEGKNSKWREIKHEA